MIARRTLVTRFCGAAALWPMSARAQQPLPVIGYLSAYSPDAFGMGVLAKVKAGLAQSGYVEGRDYLNEERWAEGQYDRLPALAADLVRRQVKVIATFSSPPTLAAKEATATIPIVFTLAGDPVALGLAASLARPGGNLTGSTRLNFELGPRRLQLLRQMAPAATSMALLFNPDNPSVARAFRRILEEAAARLGLKLHVFEARDPRGIDAAFAASAQARAGGVIFVPDPFLTNQFEQLVGLSLRHRLPMIGTRRQFVASGGLMSYGGSEDDAYQICGRYIARILKGEKPGDIPIQQSAKIEMFVNLKTAKALGLTVPPQVIAQADEVIE